MITAQSTLTPEDFADLSLWEPMPPVAPEADNRSWEKERVPVCCFDSRKWASVKTPVIVSCSGPARHWSDEGPSHQYGYCDYHWALSEQRKIFSTPNVSNPQYTNADRARDMAIVDAFWEEQAAQGLPVHRL